MLLVVSDGSMLRFTQHCWRHFKIATGFVEVYFALQECCDGVRVQGFPAFCVHLAHHRECPLTVSVAVRQAEHRCHHTSQVGKPKHAQWRLHGDHVTPDGVETARLAIQLEADRVILHQLEVLKLIFQHLLVDIWGKLRSETKN